MSKRSCSDCSLCCRLVPVKELNKPAGTRCQYQRFKVGCAVYGDRAKMPASCRLWNCRWLVNDDAANLPRPDRAHLVIDIMPDFVVMTINDQRVEVPVVQVWIDPNYPDAHREPAFREYLARRGEEGDAALIRYGNEAGLVIFPPAMSDDRLWHEIAPSWREPEHSFEEIATAVGGAVVNQEEEGKHD